MGANRGGQVDRGVGRLFAEGTLAGLGDSALLDRFATRRDELAFEAIVTRHGPMVLCVCRRVLRDTHAAEDAFQATFLVLARKAGAVRDGSGLAGWLYRVAHRISVRERAAHRSRCGREVPLDVEGVSMPGAPRVEDETAVIFEEIDRLPDRYRTPLVLCGVEGLAAEAAAERIGCAVGTVWGRLSRGRMRLRARLARRGIVLGGGAIPTVGVTVADAALPPALLKATVRVAVSLEIGPFAAVASPTAARMAEGGLAMLDRMRWVSIVTPLIAGLTIVVGAVAIGRGRVAEPNEPPRLAEMVRADPAKRANLPDGCDPYDQKPSPDGTRIAFVGSYTPDAGPKQFGLFVFDLATGRIRRLLENDIRTSPAWSPDSRRIAIGDEPGYVVRYPLAIVDVETGAVERTGVEGVGAAWSPDGRTIAVSTEIRGGGSWNGGIPIDGRIGLYDVAAKALTPITPPGFNIYDDRANRFALGGSLRPVWSPDGRRLAFQFMSQSEPNSTWVVDRDGSNLRRAFETARTVLWSPDGRTLIAKAEGNRVESLAEVDRLAIVPPDAFPGPPKEMVASIRQSDLARARARTFDPTLIFRRNRPWQNPPLDRLRSVAFLHTMAPTRLDERFAWRSDGAMRLAIERRDDAKDIGRAWIVAPGGRQFTVAPGVPYPEVVSKTGAEVDAYARDHLRGTRMNITALYWGRFPEAFERRDVRPSPDGRTIDVELSPRITSPRRPYRLHAGTMFETTSWSYLHDIDFSRSVLTIDAATHRIVRETDYGPKGLVCEVNLTDWLDVSPTESVPLRIRAEFPETRFAVDDRFAWHPEGLWILKEGSSKFPEHEAQREAVVERAIDRPDPALDAAIARAQDGLAALDAPAAPTEPRLVATNPFTPGVRIPLGDGSSPLDSLTFTLRGSQPVALAEHWDHPLLVARLERSARPAAANAQLLIVLYDDHARPLGVSRSAIPDRPGPFDFELARCDDLDGARTWSLTFLDGDRAIPVRPRGEAGPSTTLSTVPTRFDAPTVVQVAPSAGGKTRVRSIQLRRDGERVIAEVEIVGQDHWKEHEASATLILLDAADVPIAAGTIDREIHVEGDVVQDRSTLDLGRPAGDPRRAVVGLRTTLVGMPMGSRWGRLMRSNRSHPIGLFLDADDPQVWRRGLAALNDEVRGGSRSLRSDGDGSKLRKARGDARRVILPHRDRIARLFRHAKDPEGLPLLCRLAGYSGDERLAAPLKGLLDDPRAEVRAAVAIGLGLLGDAGVAPRLREIIDRPPPDDQRASRAEMDVRFDATNALRSIEER